VRRLLILVALAAGLVVWGQNTTFATDPTPCPELAAFNNRPANCPTTTTVDATTTTEVPSSSTPISTTTTTTPTSQPTTSTVAPTTTSSPTTVGSPSTSTSVEVLSPVPTSAISSETSPAELLDDVCHEDEACWNCATTGNQVCGRTTLPATGATGSIVLTAATVALLTLGAAAMFTARRRP